MVVAELERKAVGRRLKLGRIVSVIGCCVVHPIQYLHKGMAGTDIRAGFIGEMGLSTPPHPYEIKALKADNIGIINLARIINRLLPGFTESIDSQLNHIPPVHKLGRIKSHAS